MGYFELRNRIGDIANSNACEPIMKHSLKRYIVPVVIAIGILITIYYYFNPENHFFPQCIFYRVTGWECAGCGSQRMLHSLLHGDLAMAWHYNAALLIVSPILLAMVFANLFRNKYPRFYNFIYSPWIVWSVVGGMIAWWILRNII